MGAMTDKNGAPIIAQTATVNLITGVPGSFKTARTVDWILGAIEAGEVVFVSNVDGLKVKGVIPFEDPTKWQELPAGSVLVVDEAQKFFPARTGTPPAYVTAMSEMRKKPGIRILLVTQQPNYLDTYVRKLVGRHEHLVRKDGKNHATVYAKNNVMEDVLEEKRVKKLADDKYDYQPREIVKAMYESAPVHTFHYVMAHKYRVGWKTVGAGVLVVGCIFYSIFSSAGTHKAKGATEPPRPVAAVSSSPGAGAGPGATKHELTSEEFVASMQPRIPGAMWSAPMFDGRPIVAEPRSVCMASVDSCHCMSEQGTLVEEPIELCNFKAVHGESYNPHKAPEAPQATPAPFAPLEDAKPVGVAAGGAPSATVTPSALSQ